jgi:hypothetical protein
MVKKALVVGLNYPNQKHQLYGCVNDCLNWVSVLEKQFKFEEVRVLIDQNPDGSLTTYPTQIPTKHNILAQLGWLCSGVQQGDMLVFVYAGHGLQVNTGSQHADEALVPEDYNSTDEQGNPTLVFDDELHALFKRLPSGSFLTAILDSCHATHMLDVPSYVESGKVYQSRPRPAEVTKRLEQAWRKNPHAYARPRFMASVSWKGHRHKRTEEGSGQHVGRMNLDPGVTAFCFAACSTHEVALDANIKAQQQGTMSFCLQEALIALHNTCTYERLLEKASEVAEDIRSKYMPTMDQNFHLSFSPHGPPSEVVFLDPRYATVAEHRLGQHREQRRQQHPPAQQAHQQHRPPQEHQTAHAPREASTDFIPSPKYNKTPQEQSFNRHAPEPHSPFSRRPPTIPEEVRSPMPAAGPGAIAPDAMASHGMGPLPLGMGSPMRSAMDPNAANYAPGASGSNTMPDMGPGSSPQPSGNLFGMPNLFSGFGAGQGASTLGSSAPTTGGGTNLIGNLLGGAGNLFGSTAQQAQPQQAYQASAGLYPSQQTAGGFASGAYGSQHGGFSSQQAFGSQQGGFGSQQGGFSSQLQAGSMPAGPGRTPSGFGSALGSAVGIGSAMPGRSNATPHVNAYASSAFASGASAGLTPGGVASYPQAYYR